ncbi:hypothetical protein [Tropicimonas sp. S265A]|uniref:hypothetical protein n=1 Tax=Tropicimonas sp. S265A TaxID=3415134 RepID=UPI003C7B6801
MRVAVLLGCVIGLAACGGEPDIERLEPVPDREIREVRDLVSTVTSTRRDRVPGGVIITATGLPPSQGWWAAELVSIDAETDSRTMSYEFRIAEPQFAQPPGTNRSREVVVGLFLSDQRLEGISQVVIQGAQNSRSIRP